MKLKFIHNILFLIVLFILAPQNVNADGTKLSIKTYDVFGCKGDVVKLNVEVINGTAPFDITLYDCKNAQVDNSKQLLNPGVCSVEVPAIKSQDFKVKVKDACGNITTETIRMIVRDRNVLNSTFDDISLGNTPYYGRNKLNDDDPVGYCSNSFVDGSFIFFSPVSSTRIFRPGIFCTNDGMSQNTENHNGLFRSSTGRGNNGTTNYAVVTDSAYITYTDPSSNVRSIKGFYVTNTEAIHRLAVKGNENASGFKHGDYIYLTVTDLADGQSVDYYLADYRSDDETLHYTIDTWEWVDLSKLGDVRGPLKIAFRSNLSTKLGTETLPIPAAFCIDDFNGNINAPAVNLQKVTKGTSIDLHQLMPAPFDNAKTRYSIVNIDGGYQSENDFDIQGSDLIIKAARCNADLIVEAKNKGTAHYITIPVVTDGQENVSDFEQYDVIYNDCSVIGNNTFISGTYKFENDIHTSGPIGYNGVNSNSSADEEYNSVTGTGNGESTNYAVISTSGYIHSLTSGNRVKGFYIAPTMSTYNAVTKGKGIGTPYSKGDSLILTVTDTETGRKIEYIIADYRSEKDNDHYCLDTWQWVDLSSLGNAEHIRLELTGSRMLPHNFSPSICIDDFNGENNAINSKKSTARHKKNTSVPVNTNKKQSYVSNAGRRLSTNHNDDNAAAMAVTAKAPKTAAKSSKSPQSPEALSANDSASIVTSDTSATIAAAKAPANRDSSKQKENTSQEQINMRIIYLLLIVIVLAIILMLFYIRRQREKGRAEIDSLKQRYADMLLKYDKAKDEIASLKSSEGKHTGFVSKKDADKEVKAIKDDLVRQLSEKEAEIERLKQSVAKFEGVEKELNTLKTEFSKQLSEKEAEIQHLKDSLSETEHSESEIKTLKEEFDRKISEKDSEIDQLKQILLSYQENVNPDVWDAEQNLLQHETIVQLHRNVDSGRVASGRQWDDLMGVVSKLMPDFYNALSAKGDNLTDNEFKVSVLTRINFLPTEMAVLMNLSKQRVTNIRAAVNQKLFDAKGTRTFESNIHGLG